MWAFFFGDRELSNVAPRKACAIRKELHLARVPKLTLATFSRTSAYDIGANC
jgi:hypothetical protein